MSKLYRFLLEQGPKIGFSVALISLTVSMLYLYRYLKAENTSISDFYGLLYSNTDYRIIRIFRLVKVPIFSLISIYGLTYPYNLKQPNSGYFSLTSMEIPLCITIILSVVFIMYNLYISLIPEKIKFVIPDFQAISISIIGLFPALFRYGEYLWLSSIISRFISK